MNLLIQLTENDKRLLFALLLILILVFVLIGYIGMWITQVMKWQGRKMDTLVADVVQTRVITDKRHFRKYAFKKNWNLFFKQAWIPFLIMVVAALFLVIFDAATGNWSYNVFDYKKEGFNTLIFVWDFSNVIKTTDSGLLLSWPALINSPHIEAEAWASYVFVPLMFTGAIWYLITLQALIARTIKVFKLSTTIFEKNLDGFNQNQATYDNLNKQVQNNTNPNNNNQ